MTDLTGKTIHRLTFIEKLDNGKYRCLCSCGNIVVVVGAKVSFGHTKSCGCYAEERISRSKPIEWVERKSGCWECVSHKPNAYGYPQYGHNRKNIMLSRFIYSELFGEIPEGMFVMHRCDNPACINPEHLIIGTPRDNTRDMVNKGRHARGERNGHSLLRENEVEFIRNNYKKIKGVVMAKMFGVSPQTICGIQKKREWAYLD